MKRLIGSLVVGVAGCSMVFGQVAGGGRSGSGGIHLPPAGGTWQTVAAAYPGSYAAGAWLMTDGTVLFLNLDQNTQTGKIYKLTPNNAGNYVSGSWSQVASMHSARLYFGSGVLSNGKLVVAGGEYSGSNLSLNWGNACEIYDPVANTWTKIPTPISASNTWSNIGDAPSVVLPNGTFLLGHDFSTETAIYDPVAGTWSQGGSGIPGSFDEDSWTLLPNGRVLDIECQNSPNTEYYDIANNVWDNVGRLPSVLADSTTETGANVLLPNGTVFALGAVSGTDIYNVSSNSWSAGPTMPILNTTQLCQADAPAAVLPNGNVLCAFSPYSPGNYPSPTYMYEFNGTSFSAVANPNVAQLIPAYSSDLLVLPSGQILMTSQSNEIDIYTPTGTYQAAWQPTISAAPGFVNQGVSNYSISGTQFTGVSTGSAYGDDATNFTNYPLVRIQNNATGHVFYCRTHDHSTMAVATGSATVSTHFDVPAGVETGPSQIFVVANGIPSAGQPINVAAPHVVLANGYSLLRGVYSSGTLQSLAYVDSDYLKAITGPVLQSSEGPIELIVTATSPTLTPSSLSFTLTGKSDTPGLSQTIALFNYSTGQYDVLDTRAATTSNQTVTVHASGTLSNYVNASGTLKARIAYFQVGPTIFSRWSSSFDLANWSVQ